MRFDFQAAGEFLLGKSDLLQTEIQARLIPWGASKRVSAVSALAIRANGSRLIIDVAKSRDRLIEIDGAAVYFPSAFDQTIYHPGGFDIARHRNGTIEIWTQQNVRVLVWVGSGYLNFDFKFPFYVEDQVVGLLGQIDGDTSNDFMTRAGQKIVHENGGLSYEELYRIFGDSWRISDEESLFDYASGESTQTFTDLTVPDRIVSIGDLDPDVRAYAESICRNSGVLEDWPLKNCIYDVGLSGDIRFAEGYSIASNIATLDAPRKVDAGSTITAQWTGPANEGDFISLARPDQAGGHYESYNWAKFGSNSVSLVAPGTPGEYELRYVLYNDRQIMTRRQIMVTEAEATLSAPARVEAGAAISVEWTGPANRGDFISLARSDQTGGRYETYDWVKPGGAPVTLTSPNEPGTYELRYILYSDRKIVARIPIVVE